jgi:ubiquinone biosynthesis protein
VTHQAVTRLRLVSTPYADSPGKLRVAGRAAVVFATCVGYLVPAILGAVLVRPLRGRDAAARLLARRLVALAQRLGPTFVKVGQIVGTRRDLVPIVVCEELETLAESVTPISAKATSQAFAAAYGNDLDAFASIDEAPVASGSVASVFRATLRDGREVAVKLQRPRIAGVMAADLALVRAVGGLLSRLPAFAGVPVREVVGYVCEAIHAQLDFVREAENLTRLRTNLAAVPRVWVPSVERDATRDTSIVMQFIPHLDVNVAATATEVMCKRYAATALAAVYQMLFIDGLVHCDLHRGNLYFTRKGQVVVLDAGFTVQLSDRIRRLFAEFFFNMTVGNGERCSEIVVESATGARADADLDGFKHGIAELVSRSSRATAKEFSLIAFARELFLLQRRYGLHAASEIVFPLLSLLVIEGTIRDLDPDIDFQQEAHPVLLKAVFDAPQGSSITATGHPMGGGRNAP